MSRVSNYFIVMKKLKKQEEFSKMLDLGKEDVANLSSESMTNIQGGQLVPMPTSPKLCGTTVDLGCNSNFCNTAGCTYSCVCSAGDTCNTFHCSDIGCATATNCA